MLQSTVLILGPSLQNYIIGFVSQQHQKLVVSRPMALPPLSSVNKRQFCFFLLFFQSNPCSAVFNFMYLIHVSESLTGMVARRMEAWLSEVSMVKLNRKCMVVFYSVAVLTFVLVGWIRHRGHRLVATTDSLGE